MHGGPITKKQCNGNWSQHFHITCKVVTIDIGPNKTAVEGRFAEPIYPAIVDIFLQDCLQGDNGT